MGIIEELQRLANFSSPVGVVDDAMEKSEDIHQVKPKAAIETASIESFRDRGIMSFYHHEPVAFKTFHSMFFPIFFYSIILLLDVTLRFIVHQPREEHSSLPQSI